MTLTLFRKSLIARASLNQLFKAPVLPGENPALTSSGYGSILFEPSATSRLVYDSTAGWEFGTGNFTIECFFWQRTTGGQYARLFSIGSWPTAAVGVSLENTNAYLWMNGNNLAFTQPTLKVWNHLALSRDNNGTYLYLNGTRVISTTAYNTTNLSQDVLCIGNEPNYTAVAAFSGAITQFRLIKGTSLYSGSTITVPTPPIVQVSNTQILLSAIDNQNVITDTSVFNRVASTSNGITWRNSAPI